MKKMINNVSVAGYVFDQSKLSEKVTGENSKNPGTHFITGELDIAVDEAGINVVPVHFTYVTPTYAKSGKANSTYTMLKDIIDSPDRTWLKGGKDNAMKVQINASLALNDFIAQDESKVSAKRVEGSFINRVEDLSVIKEKNDFSADMFINSAEKIEADPERNIDEDYMIIKGCTFNFRNEILPMEFIVKNPMGISHFESLSISATDPLFTKVWGKINNQTIRIEQEEESAFGEASVTTFERKNREYIITGTAKVPYDFGDESTLTADEMVKAMQDRELLWADIKKRNDEYLASKNGGVTNTPSAPAGFTF